MKTDACFFETPIRTRKVRAGVVARQYPNGTVNIAGEKFIGYTMTEAIKAFRHKFPAR